MRLCYSVFVNTVLVAGIALGGLGCAAYHLGAPPDVPFADTEPMHCGDLATVSRKAVRDYYEAGMYDSALAALQYWTDQCGMNSTTYRTTLLLHVAAGSFSDDLYDSRIIDNMLLHRTAEISYPYYHQGHWRTDDWGDRLGAFTERIARELRKRLPEGTVEALLCECFSGDREEVFHKLQRPEYADTKLRHIYDREVKRILSDRTEANFAFYSGYWSPRDGAGDLGGHPILGAVMGGQKDGFLYNIVGEWRMGNTSPPYVVEHNGTVDTTARFDGYYTGIEVGRELVRTLQHQLFARAGAGLDGFAYDASSEDGPREKVHSYNVNLGLGYRYYLRPHGLNYIGLEGVYNIVAYDDNGGKALSGNSIGLRLLFGWGGNVISNERLSDLSYGI